MTAEPGYTLEQLAAEFGLTARTARHYLEHLLPPHHKQGRGKRARYGQDTRNCFAFIHRARAEKLTSAQIARLLRGFSQAQIERVAGGLEQLTFVPTPAAEPAELASSPCMAGDFPGLSLADRGEPSLNDVSYLERGVTDIAAGPPAGGRGFASSRSGPTPRWRVLYSDDELQITHHGESTAEQREQVRLAVALIKRILQTENLGSE
jgi:DNA-binding transcriptional MerR regulator